MTLAGAAAALLWLAILLVPWRPWRASPALDSDPRCRKERLDDVTVLVPARNEALVLPRTLAALSTQAPGMRVVLVDDQSADETASIARAAGVTLIPGSALPEGWSGKLWALEQARLEARTDYVMLLDADIALESGIVATLLALMKRDGIAFASLVPQPRFEGFWEKLLMPAFVFFFALLYPFRLSNSPRSRIAAASGGCVLAERRVLDAIGGFAALRGALIDDCTLARCVKRAGFRTWIGYTHSALGLRSYEFRDVWSMVERTAYTQLRCSPAWLLVCTALMLLAFWAPAVAVMHPHGMALPFGLLASFAMWISYLSTLRFYGLSPLWALALPLTGALFLAMTWGSALRYYRRRAPPWRGRGTDFAFPQR